MKHYSKQRSSWRTSSPFFLKLFALLAIMLVGVNGAWAQLLPTTRYSTENVGTSSFALVNLSEGKALYGTGNQNLAYGDYSVAFVDQTKCFEFKLEQANGHYLLKSYLHDGTLYTAYGGSYLNSQPNNGVSFILGLNGDQYGQDGENCALWDLESDGNGGYKLKNVGTGKYLNNAGSAHNDTGASWSLCSVGTGCKVEFNATDGSMGSVTATVNGNAISSGDYVAYGTQVVLTAHPNAGYAFKSWSNSETNPTRTWTVTQSGHPTATFEAGYTVTFGVVDASNNAATDRGTVTAKVNGNPITSGTTVASGTKVTFSVTANDPKYLSWGWYENGTRDWSSATVERTVIANLTMNAVLNQGVTFNAYPNNGSLGNVRVWLNDTEKGTTFTTNPGTTTITFRATPIGDATFDGWYDSSYFSNRVSTETTYTVPNTNNGLDLWAKFTAPSFDPSLALSGTAGGNVESYTGGVLTVKGGSNNVIRVKDNVTGHANDYTGIRLATQGKACRVIVRWGPNDDEERSIKVIDEADKRTTSYYSWSMLGVPQAKVSSISDIYFAGAQDYSYSESNTGVTTFSDASLVNVTETTPYTREIGEVREFILNDTRVELYGHVDHYQMGEWSFTNNRKANIQWVYKSETDGQKYVTMKTTGTSNNMIEIFNSGHNIASYDGIHIDYKGQHFRVIAYKGDEKRVYTVPASTDKMTARFVTWKDLGITDRTGLTRIEVAGCSEHDSEESVNFYGIRLYKSLKDVIYTDESVTEGVYNGNLAYKENHDGNNMSVVFKNIGGGDRADDCQGTIVRKDDTHGFTLEAPGSHKITKVIVGLGENSTSKVLFNGKDVEVNNKSQIDWENTAATSTVTMTIPSDAANVLHVKYVYYELEEIAIPSIDVNGQIRQYVVYAPDGITSSETSKVGVVFSLHGASNDYWNGRVDFDAIARSNMNTDKKFVVVYPRGLMRQLRGTERGWETYTESNTEDVDFFKEIVKELKKTYTVDDNRIYLAGFSNGGMMAYKAAHQAGDFFAAFASVGGYPVNESHLFHAGSQPTPFIHIQGKADEIFPDATYPLSVVAHTMMFRNGANFNPAGDGNGVISPHLANVEEDCHNAAEGGAAYYMYKVDNMGHTWTYDWDNDGQEDIAATMWKFFNKDNIVWKEAGVEKIDKTLKFRIYDTANFWNVVTTGRTSGVNVGYIGFEKPNGKTVLSYGGLTKTSTSSTEYNKDTNNKNLWHSLQFKGVVGGTPHFLKLNITTTGTLETDDYFVIKLAKTGETTPVVLRRYQAKAGQGDYFINFNALNNWNEYKLTIERSREGLDVEVNGVEFHSGSAVENEAFFPANVNQVLSGMNPIYQPVYGQTYDGIAKEYIPIANIPANDLITIADTLKAGGNAIGTINSSSTTEDSKLFYNIAISNKEGEQKAFKSKNAYVLGTGYTTNSTNGIALSHNGPAGMPAYVAGSGDFPTQGVIAMKVQGTFDLTFLLHNALGDTPRKLKVYYTNDQLNGELKEWKNWDFTGTRNETNANGKNVLGLSIRMQHLGQDGTSTIFLTYEGSESDDNVWVKGIIAVRPNLDVTIGRTDTLRYKNGNPINAKNDKLTCFGENKPYQWNFGTSNFSARDPKTGEEAKKINMFDGRTYVTGLGPNGEELGDHLLVFSDGASDDNKASFDGRPSNGRHKGYEDDLSDNNEHIEFNHPTKYSGTHASGAKQEGFDKNRRSFTPILSNGLKVNVTGSGWFTIACSAPNGAVNMKVLSSTNGGNAYINLLREFRVEKSNDPKPETDWQTYRVYLKAHAERNGDKGFWAGDYLESDPMYGNTIPKVDPEDTQMSLYVVFDSIGGVDYKDNGVAADAQLNIHYLQWLNEMPADYVFQREENPALLDSLQSIKSSGTDAKPGLYWQAGTSKTENYKSNTPTGNGSYDSAYNSAGQEATVNGQTSSEDEPSTDLGCMWNVAAKAHTIAHTEADYVAHGTNYGAFENPYSAAAAKSTERANAASNLEFALPMSGSFLRFMPMKNEFISAWVVPEEGKTTKIFVLDETGMPIPFISGADMQDENKSMVTQEARERGWINAAAGAITENGNVKIDSDGSFSADGTTALRIDFAALASKEYFITSNGGTISLARLQATNNADRAKVEEISGTVALTDGADNSGIISTAMSGTGRYASETKPVILNRTFKKGKWASLVLPFSLNEKKLKEVFGNKTQCMHFTELDTENNVILLTHHFYDMVVAGRPVFIYPNDSTDNDDIVNPRFTDVTLQAKEVTTSQTENGFEFYASYNNTPLKKNDLYMNSSNTITYLNSNKEISYPGMRSFIKNNAGYDPKSGGITGSMPLSVSLANFYNEDVEDVTGIEALIAEEFGEDVIVVTNSTNVYDLNGRMVAKGADLKNLPSGVYIVNGKKYIK